MAQVVGSAVLALLVFIKVLAIQCPASHGSRMHLIAVDVWQVLKVGLSVFRVINFKQRYVQISLLKLFVANLL